MKFILVLLSLSITITSSAQDFKSLMSVNTIELEQNYYARDSTASALVIYDYGNSFIDGNYFLLNVEIKQKIKILKKDGLDRGEIEIKLYKGKSSNEKISKIKGATHNLENGKIVRSELTESAIFKEDNEDYTLVKIVLPNVKVGSIITYSYTTTSPFIRKYQPWYFQGQDPVLYSEYNTSIPGNYDYHVKLVGSLPLDVNDISIKRNCIEVSRGGAADCYVGKYVMKNIPAYKPESYTTTALNYTARIEYELNEIIRFDGSKNKLAKTWKDVDNELKTDDDFGKQLSKKNLVKNILPESIGNIKDKLTKAKAIYQFVLDNYNWNNKSERYQASVKNLIKEKVGSVFEINMLLENLLTSEGFKVYPVLISTRNNGLITKIYPVLTDFNYVILKTTINETPYYLDATESYLTFGELPFRCLNQYGRIVDFENGSSWEPITLKNYASKIHTVELTLNDEDEFTGVLKNKFTSYYAHNLKVNYGNNPEQYKDALVNKYPNISIEDYKTIDYDEKNSDFKEQIDFVLEPELIGNKIYLNPFITKFFDENPFKLQERTYPIDFGFKLMNIYVLKINLNNAYKLVEIPTPINIALPNKTGAFTFNISAKDNQVDIYFKIRLNEPIYDQTFYDGLKELMNRIVETQNNTFILLEKQ